MCGTAEKENEEPAAATAPVAQTTTRGTGATTITRMDRWRRMFRVGIAAISRRVRDRTENFLLYFLTQRPK